MNITKTDIDGLLIIEPKVFNDSRGYFYESYNKDLFDKLGIDVDFIQDNQSLSNRGTLRGLHFQKEPYAQDKLVRVIKGSVLDVAVDIRPSSPTYGQWRSIVLSEENKLMFLVPKGFAHGFITLEDNTIFQYKCSNVYNKESEGGILWSDPQLNIDWGLSNSQGRIYDSPIVSEKDMILPSFYEYENS